MGLFKKINESAGLVQDMAAHLDVDLAHLSGLDAQTSVAQFRSAVMRCANCDRHEECRHLLDETATLDAAPDYCRNRNVMVRT
ncbi:DUF6455 family protein [Nioella nitratireducens]|uniref:DUF6455 family protein n=1 Tax=Nioella nitratireducens TaxID=1287720 RepID=UPI0008FD8AC4|nr:DUF6455 family protein [Nioella nitratireducens]